MTGPRSIGDWPLTADQTRLHDELSTLAGWTGADPHHLLDDADASAADKAAVAEVFGGPGSGSRYQAITAAVAEARGEHTTDHASDDDTDGM
ncbi:hypothetical protein [Dactylosporangium sp. CA-092794]|uniref:hypothetical protein n=1 Tax=Dactylosporangium sp. CA-092794 TaxID=3239929 RepID=UPI003D8E7CFB